MPNFIFLAATVHKLTRNKYDKNVLIKTGNVYNLW